MAGNHNSKCFFNVIYCAGGATCVGINMFKSVGQDTRKAFLNLISRKKEILKRDVGINTSQCIVGKASTQTGKKTFSIKHPRKCFTLLTCLNAILKLRKHKKNQKLKACTAYKTENGFGINTSSGVISSRCKAT